MDPDSATIFTLALTPGNITDCVLGDSSMTRPVKLTIAANRRMLLTEGGIHYSLDRRGPNLYEGGNYIKIAADLRANAQVAYGQRQWRRLQVGCHGLGQPAATMSLRRRETSSPERTT
jgi:hypothetical protein